MPIFHKRHYDALAMVIRDCSVQCDSEDAAAVRSGVALVRRQLMTLLAQDNVKFDKVKFLVASSQ